MNRVRVNTCENCDRKTTIGVIVGRSVFCVTCARHTQIEAEKMLAAEAAKVRPYAIAGLA